MLLKSKPVRTIFDLGASEGVTAEYYRRLFPNAHVYSFEPTDAPYARLEERFKSDPNVTPVYAAVGEATGRPIEQGKHDSRAGQRDDQQSHADANGLCCA